MSDCVSVRTFGSNLESIADSIEQEANDVSQESTKESSNVKESTSLHDSLSSDFSGTDIEEEDISLGSEASTASENHDEESFIGSDDSNSAF